MTTVRDRRQRRGPYELVDHESRLLPVGDGRAASPSPVRAIGRWNRIAEGMEGVRTGCGRLANSQFELRSGTLRLRGCRGDPIRPTITRMGRHPHRYGRCRHTWLLGSPPARPCRQGIRSRLTCRNHRRPLHPIKNPTEGQSPMQRTIRKRPRCRDRFQSLHLKERLRPATEIEERLSRTTSRSAIGIRNLSPNEFQATTEFQHRQMTLLPAVLIGSSR